VTHDNQPWQQVAACCHTDPDLFFPVSSSGRATDQVAAAKAFCQHCPAAQPCLDFALRTRQAHGIWGGTTEEERGRMWRHQPLTPDPDARTAQRRSAHDGQHPAPGNLAE
jgi:WhiB family transcriptional regulator, redox-sensing transcriptional regulator